MYLYFQNCFSLSLSHTHSESVVFLCRYFFTCCVSFGTTQKYHTQHMFFTTYTHTHKNKTEQKTNKIMKQDSMCRKNYDLSHSRSSQIVCTITLMTVFFICFLLKHLFVLYRLCCVYMNAMSEFGFYILETKNKTMKKKNDTTFVCAKITENSSQIIN